MALFKKTKEEKEEKVSKKDAVADTSDKKETAETSVNMTLAAATYAKDLSGVLKKPRITEKAALLAEKNRVYTFNVAPRSTKTDVINAVKTFYKVTPKQVRMVTVPTKQVRVRGSRNMGTKGGGKKAYVYLQKGDSIEFV